MSRAAAGPVHTLRTDLAVCAGLLLACCAWAAWRGQDTNWDLQNYHLYDAFALLHGRDARDVAPAGPQSYLNPLPYLPVYVLHRLLPPLIASLSVAAIQALCLMPAWWIARALCRDRRTALLAMCAACAGPVVLSELGTSFADLVLAGPPLVSLALLLCPPSDRPAHGSRLLLAGTITGLAIGVKPTGLFLLPALAAFAMLPQERVSRAVIASFWIAAGAGLGAALTDGLWALHLWHSYASPVFPLLNTIFHSASAARVDFGDPRYHFTSLQHAVRIPFQLAAGSDATGEIAIRDLRPVLGICLGLPWLAWHLVRRKPFDPLAALAGYILIGLAGWLVLCPIQRYAAVLEILCGLFVVLLADRIPLGRHAAVALLTGLLLIATTRAADYFHRPWDSPVVFRVPTEIGPGATYGLLAQPLADWVAAPPYPAHSFGLSSTLLETGGVLQRRLDRMLEHPSGALWLVSFDVTLGGEIREEMRIHGIVQAPPCLRTASPFWVDAVFCRGLHVGPRTLAAPDLEPGRTVAFSSHGYGLIYELSGFGGTDPDATWATGNTSSLVFHLDRKLRAAGACLTVRLAGMVGARDRNVTLSAAGAPTVTVRLGPPGYFAEPTLCIPPGPGADGTIVVSFSTPDVQSPLDLKLGPDPRPLSFKLYDMTLQAASGIASR